MIHRLQKLPLFQQMSANELQQLLPYLSSVSFQQDVPIIQQGHVGASLYILEEGTVDICLEHPNKIHIATLSIGAFFGEMSCMTGDPISATVMAKSVVKAFSLSRDGMLNLMDRSESFRQHMIEAMVKRIQQSNVRVSEEYSKSLYLMKRNELDDRDRYGELIGDSDHIVYLRSQVERYRNEAGNILIVGEAGVGKRHVARRIHYTSNRQYEPVISIEAEQFNWSEWEALVSASQRGTLIIENIEKLSAATIHELVERNQQMHLIMTCNDERTIAGCHIIAIEPLRERAEDIPLLAKHYLQKTKDEGINEYSLDTISEEALRMLALFPYLTQNITELITIVEAAYIVSEGRTIQSSHLKFNRFRKPGTRPTVGLALGSGSLRGMSHIGVIRSLQQAEIPIDIIAGTSAGSLVGGAFAAGMSVDELEKAVTKLKWNNIVSLTFPKKSIVHNEPLIGFIESYLGDVQIEHLKMPFAAVASDSNTGEAHIMRKGSLAKAIAASTAIPAVMRPVQYQGKTLVDGAVVHPVPAALARSMGADIVVAVNVCSQDFTKGAPTNFVKSLLNTIDIMSAKLVKEELQMADVVIRPELDNIQNGFKDFKQYIHAGEQVTREHASLIQQQMLLLK
ncbi:MAG: patatin-like phospholipase family protein [Candidatus Pristimantibacillus lignocellulolyticus]|uniref:Patatin-like phospholipase family protein n=1 Tax=Candidatus Pristimantibacillus lignocellulolyticus TaxID=2994561 RepID=A0A9J6ZKD0_9BACL|nr:MAG: patatin-like phospholipase family protein [Candidatus Pristimantibacillus lignocellulolyticus]